MFRFLVFLLVVLALALLFAWVADNPGNVFLQWEWLAAQMGRPGEEVGIPLTLAFALLIGLIFIIMLAWSILRGIIGAPSMVSTYLGNRKREKGYKALSKGLIAASSGDASTARKLTKESKKLLGQDPLVSLLGTQTAILEGKRDEARENFKAMLGDDSTKMVALRGLFMEAERQGEAEAARHYAEEAAKADATLPWAGNAKLRYAAADGDWDEAITTLESNRSAGLIEKATAKRQRAVLLTGKAMSKEDENPDYALKLSKEAFKLARDLAPAATTFARVSTRLGDPKGARKILEAAWKQAPHPELAEAYAAVGSGESVKDRLEHAKKLASIAGDNPEGKLALATAAINATEWDIARKALESVLTTSPTERAYLLMADIEEGQHGDKGRMRDWLARAVRAPADPAWVAGNYVSDEWMPLSPITGDIDAFEWKVPVQQLGDESAPVMTLEELKAEATVITPEADEVTINAEDEVKTSDVEDAVIVEAGEPADGETKTGNDKTETADEKPSNEDNDTATKAATVAAATAAAGAIVVDAANDDTADEKADTSSESKSTDNASAMTNGAAPDAVDTATSETEKSDDTKSADKETQKPDDADANSDMPNKLAADTTSGEKEDGSVEFPLKRRPDDPGPHPDKEPPKKGFKLF
jgi:HemY protein